MQDGSHTILDDLSTPWQEAVYQHIVKIADSTHTLGPISVHTSLSCSFSLVGKSTFLAFRHALLSRPSFLKDWWVCPGSGLTLSIRSTLGDDLDHATEYADFSTRLPHHFEHAKVGLQSAYLTLKLISKPAVDDVGIGGLSFSIARN